MDYLTLTKTKFFKMIGGDAEINPNKAYQEFIMQVIELCKQADDGYKAVALTYAETELHFVSGVPADIDLCAKKAQAFVQKMLRLTTEGKEISFVKENTLTSPIMQWTGKKADFVELVYGVQTMGVINDGNISVRDLLEILNRIFWDLIPFEQCYGTYQAIKRRKLTARAAFLESMMHGLHNRMAEDDKRERERR